MESREQIERRLAEIEASLKATTRALWSCCDIDGDWAGIYAGPDDDVIGRVETEDVGEVETEDNGTFIVEAHNDFVPYLLALVKSLLPALDVARAAVAGKDASDKLGIAIQDRIPNCCEPALVAVEAAKQAYDAALAAFAAGQKGEL